MTIENLINIIGGELQNEPKINRVESATIYPSKVDSGDLFFATDKESAQKAIENGAFAIVYEAELEITDSEIAYIKVESIKEATLKFLRYIVLQKESKIYLFEDIDISFLKQIVSRRSSIYTIISSDWKKSFEAVLNSDYEVYITNSKELAESLSPNYRTQKELAYGYIISDSLLKTTFKIDKYIYQNAQMSPLFIDNIKKVVKFCQDWDIEYDINRLKYTKEFRPFYVEDDLTPSNIGTTEKVLIFVNNLKIVDRAIQYLRQEGKWIKSIVLTPPKSKLETVDRPNWYQNEQEAKEILKNNFFHYAFCYNLKPEDILNKEEDNNSLF